MQVGLLLYTEAKEKTCSRALARYCRAWRGWRPLSDPATQPPSHPPIHESPLCTDRLSRPLPPTPGARSASKQRSHAENDPSGQKHLKPKENQLPGASESHVNDPFRKAKLLGTSWSFHWIQSLEFWGHNPFQGFSFLATIQWSNLPQCGIPQTPEPSPWALRCIRASDKTAHVWAKQNAACNKVRLRKAVRCPCQARIQRGCWHHYPFGWVSFFGVGTLSLNRKTIKMARPFGV